MSIKFDIGIACGKNSEPYLDFLLKTIDVTALNKHRYIIGITNEDVNERLIRKSLLDRDFQIVDFSRKTHIGSKSHGECLNAVLDKMQSEYGCIIDCDCAMLDIGWDEYLVSKLNEKEVIIGAEYPFNSNKYLCFPNAIFSIFNVGIFKKLRISFLPKCDAANNVATERISVEESKIFNRDMAFHMSNFMHFDTGWEIPYKLKKNGYDGIPINLIWENKRKCIIVNKEPEGNADEFNLEGKTILTHIGRSSSRDFFTNKRTIVWRKEVSEYLKIINFHMS